MRTSLFIGASFLRRLNAPGFRRQASYKRLQLTTESRAHWLPVSDVALVEDPLPAGAPSRYADLKFTDAGLRVRAFAARLAKEPTRN